MADCVDRCQLMSQAKRTDAEKRYENGTEKLVYHGAKFEVHNLPNVFDIGFNRYQST